ncbi:MAG: ABC transporter ATP-binding protein [bacterium]|nr:ABC transporter ATP-binding protein [bacterium]
MKIAQKQRKMIEFDPVLEKDPELDRPEAKSFRDHWENIKRLKGMFGWIWKELINFRSKRLLLWMLIPTVMVCVIGVIVPMSIRTVIDGISQSQNLHNGFNSTIKMGIIQCGVLWIISEFLQAIKRITREYLMDENSLSLRNRTNVLFFSKALGEHIVENRLLNEPSIKKGYERVEAQQKLLLFDGIETILNTVLAYGAVWYISWSIKSWVLGGIITAMLTIFVIWSLYLYNRVMVVCLPLDKCWSFLTRYQSERWRNVQRVVTSGKVREEIEAINDYYKRTIKLDLGFWIWFIWQLFFRSAINILFLVGIIVYGALQAVRLILTIGAFYPILNYTFKLIDSLSRISDIEHQINYWSPSVIKLRQALTKPKPLPTVPNPIELGPAVDCKVVFTNVGFSYPRKKKEGSVGPPVLHQVSFMIEAKEKVALIGRSGSGKTTAMQLLLRFMDPTSGNITIDGTDLRQINYESWMRKTGYIPQEAQVFSGSLRDNLLYGLPHAEACRVTDAELWEVVRALQLDLEARLDEGLDTQLGHYGIDLSGGQKQRLMIVAAVMKNPRFMIIDEATSSLDGETEHLVQRGLEMVLGRDVGALIVTHRLATVRNLCDKFVMIHPTNGHGGEVIAVASSFEELADNTPNFRQLAAYQGIVL